MRSAAGARRTAHAHAKLRSNARAGAPVAQSLLQRQLSADRHIAILFGTTTIENALLGLAAMHGGRALSPISVPIR